MNLDTLKIIGTVPEDDRIAAALEEYEKGIDDKMAKAVMEGAGPEKVSPLHLRKPGLMQSAMLARVTAVNPNIPGEFQLFVYLFTLGAPLADVYAGLDEMEKKGWAMFMARVHGWWEGLGITAEQMNEIVADVTESFELAAKLNPGGEEGEGVKKKPSLGG